MSSFLGFCVECGSRQFYRMDESEDYVDLLVGSDEEDDFDIDEAPKAVSTKTANVVSRVPATAACAPVIVPLPPVASHNEDTEMADEDGQIVSTPPQPNGRTSSKLSEEYVDDLYHSMNVDGDGNLVGGIRYRLDTIHLRGVDDLSSSDVNKIFQDGASIKPTSIEWISDTACNVVFLTELAAATALYKASRPLKVVKKVASEDAEVDEGKSEIPERQRPEFDADTGEELVVSSISSFPIPVPQGRWRVIKRVPSKAKQIILRFALTTDRKPPNAQKYSQYYEKHGPKYEGERRNYHRETNGEPKSQRETENRSSRTYADIDASKRYSSPRKTTVILPSKRPESTPYDRSRNEYGDVRKNYIDLDAPEDDAPILRKPTVVIPPRRHGSSPYERPRSSGETRNVEQERLPLASNDLRCLLQKRSNIPQNDLRHRLSRRAEDSSGSRPSARPGDLRSRINRVRENEELVFDARAFDQYEQYDQY